MVVRVGTDDNEEVVVLAEVERKTRWIERHVAEIRSGMSPGHEAVATRVLEECIEKAREIGVTDLMYFHLATQASGIAVMKRLGFVECGLVPRYYKRGLEYIDRVYLCKSIS